MAKTMQELRAEFKQLVRVPCSDEDAKKYRECMKDGTSLPTGIEYSISYGVNNEVEYSFYTIKSKLSEEELKFTQLEMINTIKNCLLFFVILTIVLFVISFILFLGSM